MDKNTKIVVAKISVLVFEVLLSLALTIGAALWNEMDINKGIALVASEIALMLSTNKIFEMITEAEDSEREMEQYDKLRENTEEMMRDLRQYRDIKLICEVDDISKKISEIENKEQRDTYITQFENFKNEFISRINDDRSGALTRTSYYNELTQLSELMIKDKKKYDKKNKNSKPYPGEIWAMTWWQDDELDLGAPDELKWVKRMAEMDKAGIKTKRICIMKDKVKVLQKTDISDNDKTFYRKMAYYADPQRECQNTIVYAQTDIDDLNHDIQRGINKGFFAVKLADGMMRLIRGVSLDYSPTHNVLGGEIDFNVQRIIKIRNVFDQLIVNGQAMVLENYLEKFASAEAQKSIKSEYVQIN